MKYETTSLNTKKLLSEAFKNLLKKKPFSHITVRELTQECGLNRNTFYYHFEDINSLLKWTLEWEAINVVKNFDLMLNYEEAIEFVMDYIEENDRFLSNIYYSVGQNELKRFFYNDFNELVATLIQKLAQQMALSVPEDYQKFLCHFYTEAIAGMILEVITNPALRKKEKTLSYMSAIINNSIPAALSAFDTKQPSTADTSNDVSLQKPPL